MDERKNGETPPQSNVEKTDSPERGRVDSDPQKTTVEKGDDISQVDQQEGQMNNGELGGNFEAATGSATT